jgi:hypothetical protein
MRKRLGELLIELGAATSDDVKAGLGQVRALGRGQRLGQVLISMGKITPTQLAQALAMQFNLPFIELPEIPSQVSSLLPVEFQREHRVVPFRIERDGKSERLHFAVADPSALGVIDELRFRLGRPLQLWVAASSDIDEVVRALEGDAVELTGFDADLDGDAEPFVVESGAPIPAAAGASIPPPPPPLPDDWAVMEASALSAVTSAAGAQLDDLLSMPAKAAPPTAKVEVVKFEPRPRLTPSITPVTPMPALPPRLPEQPDGATPVVGTAQAQPAAAPGPKGPEGATPVLGTAQVQPAAAPGPKGPEGATPVVGTAQAQPAAQQAPERLVFSDADLDMLENLGRLADGDQAVEAALSIKPSQMVASLIRLLIRKGVIEESEFLEEVSRK